MEMSEHICSDDIVIAKKIKELPSDDSISHMSHTFNALQCTTRLKILFLLLQGEMCVKEIKDALGISQSSISHSLRNLRQLDLVRVKKEGRFAVYYVADEHVEMLMSMCREHVEENK